MSLKLLAVLALLALALLSAAALADTVYCSDAKESDRVRDTRGNVVIDTVSKAASYSCSASMVGSGSVGVGGLLQLNVDVYRSYGYAWFDYDAETGHEVAPFGWSFSDGSGAMSWGTGRSARSVVWSAYGRLDFSCSSCTAISPSGSTSATSTIVVYWAEAWFGVLASAKIEGAGCGGGQPPPPPPPPPPPSSYTLTIQVYRATASGATSIPANGTRVRVGSAEYAADASGRVSVTLQQGSYEVEVLTTYYGPQLAAEGSVIGWRRYRFWRWSDNVVSNPRTVNLNRDTTLTVYVWDERALLVRWEPHFDGDAWGVVNATSGARFRHGELVWLPVGGEARLLPVEGGGALFTYWLLGSECIRGRLAVADPHLKLTVNQTGISATAVFRLAATNQTMLPPGAGVANPITYVPGTTPGGEERMGRKGWWLVTVTHVVTNKISPAEAGIDEKTWIYALLAHANGSSRWAPVAGTWKLHLAQDWSQTLSRHVKDLPGGVKIIEWDQSTVSDFPKVQEPQEWRDWHFVTLSAWDPMVYEELGRSYSTAGLWLENGTTLALYNISFTYMGVNGSQVEYAFWQPLTVSTLTFRAEAVYTLTSHVAAPPGRRSIYMYIHVNATWKYVPPQRWQLLGFKVHAPQLGFLASLEEPGCTGTFCISYWAPPSLTGPSWRLYVISLGDTEDFYAKPYPSGLLGSDGYSSVREFRVSMRWLGAGGRPSTLIWGSDKVTFRLAPASVYKLDWADPRGPFTATWGCFAQGPSGLTPISSYKADITFDWGATGSTHPLKGTQRFTGVTSPCTVNVQVSADDWIAFYPIPEGGRYAIAQDGMVPVPLVAKYPPRAGG
ncbi:MAG: hypothetical protein QXJ21_05485 [Thermofilum sp.]